MCWGRVSWVSSSAFRETLQPAARKWAVIVYSAHWGVWLCTQHTEVCGSSAEALVLAHRWLRKPSSRVTRRHWEGLMVLRRSLSSFSRRLLDRLPTCLASLRHCMVMCPQDFSSETTTDLGHFLLNWELNTLFFFINSNFIIPAEIFSLHAIL